VVRKTVICSIVLFVCAAIPRSLPAEEALQFIDAPNLRLLYIDPTETYLVPHVGRSFENSLNGQRAIFGYEPTEPVTTLLVDFVDYGNAGAMPVPRNSVVVDIAPKIFTFETSAPAERMFTWMNHELVHLAATDMAGSVACSAAR